MWAYRWLLVVVLLVWLVLDARYTWGMVLSEGSASLQTAKDESTLITRRGRKRRASSKRWKKSRKPKTAPSPTTTPASGPENPSTSSGGAAPLGTAGRATRIEFDAALIKGQTTKAGEVQILERKDTELKSMVKRRTSFREEIIHTVFPDH